MTRNSGVLDELPAGPSKHMAVIYKNHVRAGIWMIRQ